MEILVLGTGISGLNTALHLMDNMKDCSLMLLSKGELSETNSHFAQGGIACVMNHQKDSFSSHIFDTLKAGKYSGDVSVVNHVIKNAPKAVSKLEEIGVEFDRKDGEYDLALEGGHTHPRILHIKDVTGMRIQSKLIERIRSSEKNNTNLLVKENCFVYDVKKVVEENGENTFLVYAFEKSTNLIYEINTTFLVLATGGSGQLYGKTTNTSLSTGDGISLAHTLGAKLKNLKYYQFHPTATEFTIDDGRVILITEALRGEGAYIVDDDNRRFVLECVENGELGARDEVSRCITAHLNSGKTRQVWLDIRHLNINEMRKKYIQLFDSFSRLGIDPERQLMPIIPAAHYQCGGVQVDLNSETSVENLFAVGEVSYTGLHGENRLASNSLLEAMIFSLNAAECILSRLKCSNRPFKRKIPIVSVSLDREFESDQVNCLNEIKEIMFQLKGEVSSSVKQLMLVQLEKMRKKLEVSFNKSKNPSLLGQRNMIDAAILIIND